MISHFNGGTNLINGGSTMPVVHIHWIFLQILGSYFLSTSSGSYIYIYFSSEFFRYLKCRCSFT